MKKYVVLLFFLTSIGSVVFGEVVDAADQLENTVIGITNIGVTFGSHEDVNELPSTQFPVLPDEGGVAVPHSGNLPSTGDLITSIIWTLLGFSVLIVFIGVFSLKNIILETI